jgi:hypothetical protein
VATGAARSGETTTRNPFGNTVLSTGIFNCGKIPPSSAAFLP